MGRILKLLTTALDQSKESGMLSLRETGQLSPAALAMLRISTLSAWAQLQVSSTLQGYLENVVKLYRSTLPSPCLIEKKWSAVVLPPLFATQLKFFLGYDDALDWFLFPPTVSTGTPKTQPLIPARVLFILQPPVLTTSSQIFFAIFLTRMERHTGLERAAPSQPSGTTTKRKEPTFFFYIFFGLVYEALATSSADASSASTSRQADAVSLL
ncbi:hypothetical protein CVT24_013210 [Panaeolus cyanescens]|uniref:Uncharacterized protein n=1 Tax=Panaeolus cyanescens TaxID=181874 RepID=A0A409YMV2_9AGAR|nr:hypothetical protein CVT24_013210 [Panaeolus cyanescens]